MIDRIHALHKEQRRKVMDGAGFRGMIKEDSGIAAAGIPSWRKVVPMSWDSVGGMPEHLRGPKGALDIYCIYQASGSSLAARDARRETARVLARALAPAQTVLSLVCADFNFVTEVRAISNLIY